MKSFKKVLSLLLVLTMAFSLIAVAGAADIPANLEKYTDAEEIEFQEAVDLMTALKILEGFDGSTFGGNGILTREQAAKIISYMMIGSSAASSLTHAASSFSDVAFDRWSNPFITFLVSRGVIAGYGDGTFGPADELTLSQFAKMVLMAVGYGKNNEFVGTDWEHNVIALAQSPGVRLFRGLGDLDFSGKATRQQAAQIAYVALALLERVDYNEVFGIYYLTGSSPMSPGTPGSGSTLLEDIFGAEWVPTDDGLGRANGYWGRSWDFAPLTDSYYTDTVIDSFTFTSTAVMNKGYMFSNYSWDPGGIELFVNGKQMKADGTAGTTPVPTPNIAQRGSNAPIDITSIAPGAYVTLIDNTSDSKVDKIVVVYEFLAQVTAVQAAAGTVSIKAYTATGALDKTGIPTEDFAKGDYVLICVEEDSSIGDSNWSVAKYVKPASSVTAKITSYSTAARTITFDGKARTISAVQDPTNPMTATLTSAAFAGDTTFWFDSYDNIVGYKLPAATTDADKNYVYVTGAVITAANPSTMTEAVAKVSVQYTDGTKEVLNLQRNAADSYQIYDASGNDAYWTDTSHWATHWTNGTAWHTYAKNAAGEIRLYELPTGSHMLSSTATADTMTITRNVAPIEITGTTSGSALNRIIATSTTILSVVDSTGTHKTYTGPTNFPTMTVDTDDGVRVLIIGAIDPTDGSAGAVEDGAAVSRIFVLGANAPATSTGLFGVVTGISSYTADGTVYNVLRNGETTQYTSKESLSAGGIVEIDTEKDTIATKVATTGKVVTFADPTFITTSEGTFFYAAEYTFYNRAHGSIKTTAVETGDTVSYLLNADGQIILMVVTALAP